MEPGMQLNSLCTFLAGQLCVCVCSLSLNEVHNLLISLLITENKHYIKLHKANIVEVCAAAGELGVAS